MSLDVIQRDIAVTNPLSGASNQQKEDIEAVWQLKRAQISRSPSSKPDLATFFDTNAVPSSQQDIVSTNFDALAEEWSKRLSVLTFKQFAFRGSHHRSTKLVSSEGADRHQFEKRLLAKPLFEDASRPVFRARITGPVKSALKIFERWGINDAEGATILGEDNRAFVLDLRSGSRVLRSRDEKDRVRLLIEIYEGVFALFRDEKTEREWIRTKIEPLGSRSLFDLMTEGGFLSLYEAKEYVSFLNGRR